MRVEFTIKVSVHNLSAGQGQPYPQLVTISLLSKSVLYARRHLCAYSKKWDMPLGAPILFS
jgi:hypothetical protein